MSISSHERMLATLNCQPTDHTPCSFMMFKGLQAQCKTYIEFLQKQMKMGLDVCVELPARMPNEINDHYNLHGLPVDYDPQVKINEWVENSPSEIIPILVKEYNTPEGVLRAEVRQTHDWRYGNHVPFLDDYIIPRSRKFLVEKQSDLKPFRYLLAPLRKEHIVSYKEETQPYIQFARENGLLLIGGWGVGADLVGWVSGLENMIFLTHDQPDLMHVLLNMIAVWNRARMEIALSVRLDLYIKRAWYENCDFWTPKTWKQFVQPILREDVNLAHQAGAKFGYILTSNAMPLIDLIIESGVDVLIGVDPHTYDLPVLVEKSKGRICLWGGVNGHLTVERGASDEVAQELKRTMEILAPAGGFILSPVDNIREYNPAIEANVRSLIQEWQGIVA